MGGLLQLFDFNESGMAKKFLTHKKLNGLEAPRNSFDLPVETSQSYYAAGDNVLLSYEVDQHLCQNKNYPSEASMKRLIDEEIYKRKNMRQNTPSVVARLMGMDMPASDTKLVVQPIEKKNGNLKNNLLQKERVKKSTVADVPFKLSSSMYPGLDRFDLNKDSRPDRRREHPQEEELQKFKKDFEAWQQARSRECSKVAEAENIPRQFRAQDNLNKKMTDHYATSEESATECPTVKAGSHNIGGLQKYDYELNLSPVEHPESFPSQITNRNLEQLPLISESFAPTRIVILKPGPDKVENSEKSWTCSSPSTLEEKGSIEDFLEEVKERLKGEIQGKTHKRSTVARGSGTETPYSENSSPSRKIAQQIAKQVRGNVTRNLGMNLPRSESTRSYRNETQFNGPGSPEFINRDHRRFLSERLRNVLKNETHTNSPVNANSLRFEQTGDLLKDGPDIQSRSFRHESDDDSMLHRELSPRNLLRSLSAPVSGTSFGKLLLEDRHVLTGAHIRRKHEDIIEHMSTDMKKQKKEKFNIRQKVSNIRYSFNFKGKLFRRKIQSMSELPSTEHDFMKDLMSGPTVIMNFRDRPDNSTEVPPSPASVCSSAYEDFWRPTGCLSPILTADEHSVGGDTTPHVFRDISSNLNEIRRQLNQLEANEFEDTPIKEDPSSDDIPELQDPIEAYIRDLLVASGLYDGSSDKSFSRWDPLAKPICHKIFEEVEESCKKTNNEDLESFKDHQSKRKIDHKILHDLLNEAIGTVFGPPLTVSKFRRKIVGNTMLPVPRGRKLLNLLWEIICIHIHPPTDKSSYDLENMIARDLQSTPWLGLIDAEANEMGREIETRIMRDLIEEVVEDMKV